MTVLDTLPEDLGQLLAQQLREQLNQLTASIQLLTPVIREQGERYDPYLAILNQSIYRIMRLASNLEFSQLPMEEIIQRRGMLDLSGLCRELEGQVGPLAMRAGITFRVEETLGSVLTNGDVVLLRRLLLNLISNALRAAGEGGQAGLRLAGSRERVTITVWDNGAGLAERETALLRGANGVGLGLPVARRIAKLHGGTLVCEQREERGLRAILSLPIIPPETDGMLKTPVMGYDAGGGFSPVLVELSGVLPYRAYMPEDLE